MNQRCQTTAGHAIVEQLVGAGVKRVFGVPGESYLAVLDGLYEHRDEIEMVVTRQEGGAAMMAAAVGRITGKPGICLVTRGPGATNASIGVHVAKQDASPMILFVGQIPRDLEGCEAFQEIDYQAMFGSIAKEVMEINLPERAREIVARALRTSTSGQPGPVVVVLPEDVLSLTCTDRFRPSVGPAEPGPAPREFDAAISLLESASRPVIVVGRQVTEADCVRLTAFAEQSSVPLVTTVRSQDIINNDADAYVGTLGLKTTPGLENRLQSADTIVFVGTRPDALSMANLDLTEKSRYERRIVHVYPDADALGRRFRVDVSLVSSATQFVTGLLSERLPDSSARTKWFETMRASYTTTFSELDRDSTDASNYMRVFNKYVNSEAIITVGAGNYTGWAQRHRQYRRFNTLIGTESGAMGFGIPAAVGAAFEYPYRSVVAFAGDGCFLMNGQELSTIARYGLNVLVVVVNNSRFGTIRDHQEQRYPDRVIGTDLENPDYVLFARAFGAEARTVTSPETFETALAEIYPQKGLRLIELQVP